MLISLLFLCWSSGHLDSSFALPHFRLHFALPEPWYVPSEPIANGLIAERPQKDGLITLNHSHFTPKAEKKRFLEHMRHRFEKHHIETTEALTIAGFPVQRLKHHGQSGDLTLHNLSFIFSGFDQSFIFNFTAREADFFRLEKDAQQIFESMIFEGPLYYEQTRAFVMGMTAPEPDLNAMEKLLAQGADINAKDPRGKTALNHTVSHRKAVLVNWLLDHGIDIDHPNHGGKLVRYAASPTINGLFARCEGRPIWKTWESPDASKAIPYWRSPEDQLFSGIKLGSLDDVLEALEAGANTQALESNYQLSPRDFCRQLLAEFEAVNLDPGPLPSLIKILKNTP